jgi:hypothetical protein
MLLFGRGDDHGDQLILVQKRQAGERDGIDSDCSLAKARNELTVTSKALFIEPGLTVLTGAVMKLNRDGIAFTPMCLEEARLWF